MNGTQKEQITELWCIRVLVHIKKKRWTRQCAHPLDGLWASMLICFFPMCLFWKLDIDWNVGTLWRTLCRRSSVTVSGFLISSWLQLHVWAPWLHHCGRFNLWFSASTLLAERGNVLVDEQTGQNRLFFLLHFTGQNMAFWIWSTGHYNGIRDPSHQALQVLVSTLLQFGCYRWRCPVNTTQSLLTSPSLYCTGQWTIFSFLFLTGCYWEDIRFTMLLLGTGTAFYFYPQHVNIQQIHTARNTFWEATLVDRI